ncbi:MAG TPA: efflux RND transporter permease subunit [Turneriella sp.]|nr:efflux RND transporter permease subunit [Turneriella sp.]
MNLIRISILRPVFAWILMSALIIFGARVALRLGVSQLPDSDFPILSIKVTYEGATPDVIESSLLLPIEERLLGIEGLKEMKSTARQGLGQVVLELEMKRNVDVALQEVQAALSQLRLPIGIDPPVITKTNPEDQPFMYISLFSDKPLHELIVWVDVFLLDQFRFIPGIGEASITGYPERNIRVWPDMAKMRRYDLTVNDLVTAIETQHIESTAGQFVKGKDELRVRWMGEASTPSDLAKVRIIRRGTENIYASGAALRIGDISRVEDGLSDQRRVARLNGSDLQGVSIGIRKQRGQNEVALADAVRQKVADLQTKLPEGYKLVVNTDFSRATKATVFTTYEKLIIAALVTILICFAFLGSWQTAVNILFSIPTSIVGTFLIVYFAGFTLNLFTLLALTLAISIVVDDAIMLLENIVRHYRMGKNAAQAAFDGSMEILPAATAATLAVIAVFLPVVVMDGIIGYFFFQFGIVMSAAVLLSLVEAVTITPMRTAAFLSVTPKAGKFELYLEKLFEKFGDAYRRLLVKALKHPKMASGASFAMFALSMLLVFQIKQEFVPLQDQDYIIISGQAAPGASLEYTLTRAKEYEQILKQNPNIALFSTSAGAGGPSAEINQFMIFVRLKPRHERKAGHIQIMNDLRNQFKAIKGSWVSLRDFSSRGLTSGKQFQVSFNIFGSDLDILDAKAKEIVERLNKEGLTQDLDTNFKKNFPELLISPNRDAMAARQVSIQSVSATLGATVAGLREGRFTADGRRYDIRVKIPDEKITSPRDIGNILVRNTAGNVVPLSELVHFTENKTYQSINRVNRQRAIGIFGNVAPGKSQGVVLARAQKIAAEVLPQGYSFALEGGAAGLTDSFKSLNLALFLGILIAYMILAVQFNSFVHPISVLVALPFSATGALITLWITGVSLNLFSFIGLIVLMGIAKKNSILLVEFTNHVRNAQKQISVKEALIDACPVRLRPILMTSAATVIAALPLVFGSGVGHETRLPIGLTIVGGTIVSTVFTLFIVPCIYLLLTRFEKRHDVDLALKNTPPHHFSSEKPPVELHSTNGYETISIADLEKPKKKLRSPKKAT